jgi:thioredoxin
MKNPFIIFPLLAFIFFSCNSVSQQAILLTPQDFSQKLKSTQEYNLIDVRTAGEFSQKRLANAANMDYYDERFFEHAALLDKSKPTFVYCLVGGRSKEAIKILQSSGFTEIYDLKGGIMAWEKEGMEMEGAANAEAGMALADFEQLLKTDKLVLVDFNAPWCIPCRKMAPFLKKIAKEQGDKMELLVIDADKNKLLKESFKIEALPALFLYKNNAIIWQHNGFINEDGLLEVISRFAD